jgi:hypothetical protein
VCRRGAAWRCRCIPGLPARAGNLGATRLPPAQPPRCWHNPGAAGTSRQPRRNPAPAGTTPALLAHPQCYRHNTSTGCAERAGGVRATQPDVVGTTPGLPAQPWRCRHNPGAAGTTPAPLAPRHNPGAARTTWRCRHNLGAAGTPPVLPAQRQHGLCGACWRCAGDVTRRCWCTTPAPPAPRRSRHNPGAVRTTPALPAQPWRCPHNPGAPGTTLALSAQPRRSPHNPGAARTPPVQPAQHQRCRHNTSTGCAERAGGVRVAQPGSVGATLTGVKKVIDGRQSLLYDHFKTTYGTGLSR